MATATRATQALIKYSLKLDEALVIEVNLDRKNIFMSVKLGHQLVKKR